MVTKFIMGMIKPTCLIAAFCAAVTTQAQAPRPMRIEATDTRSVELTLPLSDEEGDLQAKFDFRETRGFSGSFVNVSHTVFAINNSPAVHTSYVHIWLRSADGDLIFMNNVNGRVARLLKGRFAQSAGYFLTVQDLVGRKLFLQTADYAAKGANPYTVKTYDFVVTVNGNGQLSLSR